VADPKPLRSFTGELDSLLARPTPARAAAFRTTLQRWKQLSVAVDRLAAGNPSLAPARVHAASLAEIASFLLAHPSWMQAGKGLGKAERKSLSDLLAEAGKPRGYCTLGVANALEKLAVVQ
jgi:hypothetical protein